VVYGIVGLKIHCKALLVIRREQGRIQRYLHLSTGNYNDSTARLYTDIGMFTCDPNLCRDVAALFNVMTGYAEPPTWQSLAVAPFNLRERFLALIDREARVSTPHRPGHIVAKMNSLVDPEVIAHLYKAAAAGVKIELNVRGICCLKPGVGEAARNIRVVSVVDRFLEHSRIFYFANGGKPEYYMSSADWMPRNLDRRIETLFPVYDARMQELLGQTMRFAFEDKRKGRGLKRNGAYTRPSAKAASSTRSQNRLYRLFKDLVKQDERELPKSKLQVISKPSP
jgi:polyphosphate kinase